ncbi:hypothetical protein ABE137_05395 [Brevibacillus laterosporus]|uniref:Uncharacterized protein n=3 Tax=Brevibacillus TaxID=55080 RepID=A0A075RBH6_BRELA|nr:MULTISPECIES: hypothetical protein [Brevibacillus]AIG28741.1 hypothetical protein BRLA_c044770 [Brevibacillus laterosporus LMG 15441]AKF93882.1 membrane protein [Brevibacillus laterosporus]MBA4531772.1 hypothetical protein [Brevibacillus halotolerans]MCR8984118.1 hypothetical protein [Brevibacillus laterosporus]MCZ0829837.1 hypothetical protein [Brevibacillus halotolerans]
MVFSLINGLFSGLLLSAFLAIGDGLFQTSTFQVLLDITYIPGMENTPPLLAYLIHLVISVIVAFAFIYFYPKGNGKKIVIYVTLWNVAFLILFFPFTYLSQGVYSASNILLWFFGHLLYTVFLTYQIER